LKNSNKLLSLEGLRGVASFIVLLSHIQLIFFIDIDDKLLNYYTGKFPYFITQGLNYIFRALHDGNFSVWLFWVMSGFVLSIGYFKKKEISQTKSYILASSIKRYFRLVIPVFLSVMFAYFLLTNDMMTNKYLSEKLENPWLNTFYTFDASFYNAIKSSLYDTFFNFDRLSSYNTVLWTMEKEFYGSLFIFALLSIVGYTKIRYIIYPFVTIILYTLNIHWLNSFIFGMILCDLYINTQIYHSTTKLLQKRFINLLIIIIFLVLIGMQNYYGIFHLILATLLVFFIISSSNMNKFFSSKILVSLGKISFSLYLIHLPILCSITGMLYKFFEKIYSHNITIIISSILTIVISLLLAILLNKLGDNTGINLGKKISLWIQEIDKNKQQKL